MIFRCMLVITVRGQIRWNFVWGLRIFGNPAEFFSQKSVARSVNPADSEILSFSSGFWPTERYLIRLFFTKLHFVHFVHFVHFFSLCTCEKKWKTPIFSFPTFHFVHFFIHVRGLGGTKKKWKAPISILSDPKKWKSAGLPFC